MQAALTLTLPPGVLLSYLQFTQQGVTSRLELLPIGNIYFYVRLRQITCSEVCVHYTTNPQTGTLVNVQISRSLCVSFVRQGS